MSIQFLTRPEGRIAYTDTGTGPLVVLVPGMGDLRATYDRLAPSLAEAGYRVVVTDLRGHGDSDTGFTSYGDAATASDLVALVEHLDAGPAVVVGSSMGGSAAVIASADRPDLVRGTALLAGFLRDPLSPAMGAVARTAYRVLFARPWGAAVWAWYVRTQLSKGRPTPGLDARIAPLRGALSDPAHLRAFRRLTLALDHREVDQRLADVRTPVLALYGDKDPDFSDAHDELAFARDAVSAEGEVLTDVGHYPHLQAHDEVLAALLPFLAATTAPLGDDVA
ncbi:alpha/beta fold hydrolase [Mumia quercus]|uniref:alpha/beta fold hydrolase n=1 Tax=Mumia quercus TaxID=2976125 RepID=UPI0021D1717B|nr:alpha/beta hydrolase [Mumia quercus]